MKRRTEAQTDRGIERRLSAAESAAAHLPPLLIAAERVAATVAQGVHGRRRSGVGETFWQYRRHAPGDVASAIDWRRSARSDRLYVRENEWEASHTVWFWRDASPSMDYASDPALPTKRERAEVLALALSILLTQAGERIAALGADAAPASGQAGVRRIADRLANDQEGVAFADLAAHPAPRNGKFVLISDFLDTDEMLHRVLSSQASAGATGAGLIVLDPAEEDFPFDGRVEFTDAETSDIVTFGRTETIRQAYMTRLAAHKDAVASAFNAFGGRIVTHRTDHAPEQALLALYQLLSAAPDMRWGRL